MKKVSSIIISILAVFAIGFTACSSDDNNNDTPTGTEEVVPGNNHKVLIAYFSEPLPDGVDASTSTNMISRAKPSFHSRLMAVAVGRVC